jgi:phospholipase C
MRPRRMLVIRFLAGSALLLGGLAFDVPPLHQLSAPGTPRDFTPAHQDTSPATPVKVAQARTRIKHVVFVLLENHSFDNVFGRFPGADGATTAKLSVGGRAMTTPLVPEPYYLWHDIGHNWYDALVSINHGKMDGFSHVSYADLNGDKAAYQQLRPSDIPNLYAYARTFTLSDRTFASAPGATLPNHLDAVAAQDGGVRGNAQSPNSAWGCDSTKNTIVLVKHANQHITKERPCFTFATLADRLNQARISWAYYAAPPSDLGYIWSTLDAFKQIRETSQWTQHVQDERRFEADARAGRLPAFSWVTPRAGTSMHPPTPVCPGENWIVGKLNALMSGPDWASTMVILTWDDWGGYYDHVAPPPRRTGAYGIRVPLLVISPYARRSYVAHTVYSFESVLKTAEVLWHLAPLTDQDRTAHDMLDSLDLTQSPIAPLLLQPRPCPPTPDRARFQALLHQALQSVLTHTLGLSLAQIEVLHRTQTLAQIARTRHVSPAALASALKDVAGAWAGGELILQLTTPAGQKHQVYLARKSIDALLQAPPGSHLFPLTIVAR